MNIWPIILGCAALSGCMTVDVDRPIVGHYLGYTRILGPSRLAQSLTVEDVTTFGGWMNGSGRSLSSVGLGFQQRRQAITDGDRCGLTVFVTSDAQLAAVETLIKTYAEGQACVSKIDDR
jgi:hypothetical protein